MIGYAVLSWDGCCRFATSSLSGAKSGASSRLRKTDDAAQHLWPYNINSYVDYFGHKFLRRRWYVFTADLEAAGDSREDASHLTMN